MDIITPQQLWEGYDRQTDPAAAELSNSGGEIRLYYSGLSQGGAVVRVYARLVLPEIKNPPVLILAAGAEVDTEQVDTDFFTSQGFAVLVVDYFGKREAKSRYTIYPKAVDAFWESDPKKVKIPPSEPKKSCWYYWTTCLLHSVTYLERCGHVDPARIGIVGLDEGGALVYKASLEEGIKGGVTFFCGDLLGGGEEYLPYKSCLDSRAYSVGRFPVLINATTNERSGSFDYLSGLYDSVGNSCFSVFPSADRAVSEIQRQNIKGWFDAVFSGNVPREPVINVFGSGGALYAEVITESEDVKVYYAEECPAAYRNWKEVIPPKMGENKYLCKLDVFDDQKPVYVFANVGKDGFVLTTQVVAKQPVKLGANGEQTFSRLIYQSEMTLEGWISPDGLFADSNALKMAEGRHGIDGVQGDCLITFRVGDTRFRGRSGSLLQLIVSAEEAQEVEISVIETGEAEFRCGKKIPAREWTTITLSAEDFKSTKGQARFERVVGIKIKGKSLLLNSMLWV